jgi:hypothetical protein
MRIPLQGHQEMLILKVQNGTFPIDREHAHHGIETQYDALEAKMESLFPCLEDRLVEGNHVLNVYRDVIPRLGIEAMLIDQTSNSLLLKRQSTTSRKINPRQVGMSVPGGLPYPFPHSSVSWLL